MELTESVVVHRLLFFTQQHRVLVAVFTLTRGRKLG
jgi:hypothetical protein